jgi:hypothetical protein
LGGAEGVLKMRTVILKDGEWLRGAHSNTDNVAEFSQLLRHWDKRRCCIGCYLRDCGLPDEQLRGAGTAEDIDREELPEEASWLHDDIGLDSEEASYMYAVNDDTDEIYSDHERVRQLNKLSKPHGVRLVYRKGT